MNFSAFRAQKKKKKMWSLRGCSSKISIENHAKIVATTNDQPVTVIRISRWKLWNLNRYRFLPVQEIVSGFSRNGKQRSRRTSQVLSFWHERFIYIYMRGFSKMVVPKNGWFIVQTPIRMDDWWYPILGNRHVYS